MTTPSIVAAALTAMTMAMTWPLASRLSTSLPGDYGDPLLVTWAIGWVARAIEGALAHPSTLAGFWNANIFHPETHTLAFSEHFIGQSVLVLPIYWLTRNLILSYNVVFLATFVLAGVGTFMLTRALAASVTGRDASGPAPLAAGATAALIMAFNQYRLVYEIAHLHVLSIHWLPFALLGLHRYLVTDSRRALALGALALVGLNLSSIYYMAYCAPFVVAFVVMEMVRLGRWRSLRVWLELWAAAAAVVVATLPFLLPYVDVQRRLGVARPLQELVPFSATLDHYRIALPGLRIPLFLAAVGVTAGLTRRQWWIAWPLLTLLIMAMWLSLGPVVQAGGRAIDVPGVYGILHEHVPGYDGLRVPARFAAVFFFFLALLAGVGTARLATWAPRAAVALTIGAMSVYLWQVRPRAFALDQPLPSPGLAAAPAYLKPSPELPSIYRDVRALPSDAVLLELPFGDPWYELRYMYFAAIHGRRLMNGYSGVFPASYLARQRVLAKPLLDPERAAQALAGATHVIVHRGGWPDATGTAVAARLEALGAQLVGSAGDALLYQMQSLERLARR